MAMCKEVTLHNESSLRIAKMSKVDSDGEDLKKLCGSIACSFSDEESYEDAKFTTLQLEFLCARAFSETDSKQDTTFDVSACYERTTDAFSVFRIGADKVSKKVMSKKSPRFKMEDTVSGARFVSQTQKMPNIVITTCRNCRGCCSYMTWWNGDDVASINMKPCADVEYLVRDVAMNSDAFLTIFGLANGMLVAKE